LLVSVAEQCNSRAILEDYREIGPKVWEVQARARATVVYFDELLKVYDGNARTGDRREFKRNIAELTESPQQASEILFKEDAPRTGVRELLLLAVPCRDILKRFLRILAAQTNSTEMLTVVTMLFGKGAVGGWSLLTEFNLTPEFTACSWCTRSPTDGTLCLVGVDDIPSRWQSAMHAGHSDRQRDESFQHFRLVPRPGEPCCGCQHPVTTLTDRPQYQRFHSFPFGRVGNGGSSYSAVVGASTSGPATPLVDAVKNGSAACCGGRVARSSSFL